MNETAMSEDYELLRQYASSGSEFVFAELVSRHVDFVYATALRRVGGNSHLAQDIVQNVFIALNRKATSLLHLRSLEGWLYQATRFAAAKAVRTEQRRSLREKAAIEMEAGTRQPAPADPLYDWERIAPVLDEAIEQLATDDREAILLRFFGRKNLRAVAESAGTTEEAARKRISRALGKLRTYLSRKGVAISESSLIAALALGGAAGAPTALATTVASAALAAPTALTVGASLLHLMSTAKTKIALATLSLLVIPVVVQHATISALKEDNQKLTGQLRAAEAALKTETTLSNAPAPSPPEHLELMRLRAEVTALRRQIEKPVASAPPAKSLAVAPANDSKPEFVRWAEEILVGPPQIQGLEGGNIRRKALNREELSEGEQVLLMNMVRHAESVEKSPNDFSEFQSSFVASLLSWKDDPRTRRVKEIIQAAAVTANERQMNFNAPTLKADSWPPEQKELNRTATAEVQALLTQEERATFDRAFLGIMGVDFGIAFHHSGN